MQIDDIRFRIAAARRILARGGCDSNIGGHVSARAGTEDAFWISPLEYFDETLPDRLVKVGFDLQVREGAWQASEAIRFHASFYETRPDVDAIVHLHSHWITVHSSTGRDVGRFYPAAGLFHEEQAFYDQSAFEEDGVNTFAISGAAMVAAMGDKHVLWMKNHGAVLLADSLERATIEGLELEHSARYDWEARLAGGTEYPESEARRVYAKFPLVYVPSMWEANLRRLERSDPDLWAWLDAECQDGGAPR